MDYKVIWTEMALHDVEEIAEYIAKDSPSYASSVVARIIDTTKFLEIFPFAGRVVPEENSETLREHFVYSYRVIYEIMDSSVYVLAVMHGKRLRQEGIKHRQQ